jgi:hypothetical protein
MQFHFLIDIELLPEFDENAVDGVEVIAIVSACGCEVEDDEVIVLSVCLEGLMILVPLDQQGLLSDSSIGLDDQRLIILGICLHVEPFLDHEVVFLQAASGLIFIETKHHIRRTRIKLNLLDIVRVVLELLVLLEV